MSSSTLISSYNYDDKKDVKLVTEPFTYIFMTKLWDRHTKTSVNF